MIKILRPCKSSELISARVFDELFTRNLKFHVDIKQVALLPWCDAVLGPIDSPYSLKEAARNFEAETANFDFFCPDYQCTILAPLFLSLRNRLRAKIRLLLIAHAPGAYAMEWLLLKPLLIPGDVIIAPSASAKALIEFLYPEMSPFIRVISHPMNPLHQEENGKRDRIISLGRITRGKLLHRQIEAMQVLRSRGYRVPKLHIAGPLCDGASSELSPYARSLIAKIRRLKLEDHVELVGEIRDEKKKASFIFAAQLMLNLSVTVEESFGKSVVEALGMGVPVLATRWNGLPETVGVGGDLLPVSEVGLAVDVSAEQIADAIERMLSEPPSSDRCREQAHRFRPEIVGPMYYSVLQEALDATTQWKSTGDAVEKGSLSAAPKSGLLSYTAPLMHFSWRELFDMHVEGCTYIRYYLAGGTASGISSADRLRSLLFMGIRAPVEHFLGGLDTAALATSIGASFRPAQSDDTFIDRIASAVESKATRSSRLACLAELSNANQTELLWKGLTVMKQEGLDSSWLDYFVVEAERESGNFARAFQLCITEEDPRLWGESAVHRLRQLARICREWDLPELALPWLRQWLEAFPDSPDSGLVWLDRCVNASRHGRGPHAEAREAFVHAQSLLGNSPVLDKVEALLRLEIGI